ncbi:MAG: caspase family protein [Thiohalomonadales bacterium]
MKYNQAIKLFVSQRITNVGTHSKKLQAVRQQPVKSRASSWRLILLLAIFMGLFAGCQSSDILILSTDGTEDDADKLLIVDCLLPGQIKRLGAGATFVTPRRPAKLTALECQERGGEYVAYEQANSASALKVWLMTAQEGNPKAQTYVGEIYEKGFGIRPDYKLAALWYEKAAKQGNARAKLNLGYLYEKGLGVVKNVQLALNLYRQASGLQDTDIDFESVLDAETVDDSVSQLTEMKNNLQVEEKRLADLSALQNVTQESLQTEQQSLEDEAQRLAQERNKIAEQQKLASVSEQEIRQREEQLAKRNKKLKQKETALKKQKQLFALPPAQRVATVSTPTLASRSKVNVAGPSIQLIRPKLVTMRGIPAISVRPENKTREIVGRVNAPGGLESFYVNGKLESIDPRGLFRVLFPVSQKRNPIKITAVDRFGKSADLEFELVQSSTPIKQEIAAPDIDVSSLSGDFGRFHALIIGNNNYTQFPVLQTAINDAKSVAEVLSRQYGFKTTTLINANRFMILASLNRLSKRLTTKDNLLIYYAGHGELSANRDVGYWLPVDADRNNKRKWIPNSAISDLLSSLPAKRVLVVADSCYSGSLTRSSVAQQNTSLTSEERLTWLRALAKSRARMALTSGGLQPVVDSGDSKHSIFANALLGALKSSQGVLEGLRLFNLLSGEVVLNARAMNIEQNPEYAPIRYSGHESGEFFFLKRS